MIFLLNRSFSKNLSRIQNNSWIYSTETS